MFIHAWNRIKSDPLFACLYIFGSALSIASAMIIVIYLHVKLSDIYPEHDRTRLYELGQVDLGKGGGWIGTSAFNPAFVESSIASLPGVKDVAMHNAPFWSESKFSTPMTDAEEEIECFAVNEGWFSVYDFDFIRGRRLSAEEFRDGLPVICISDRLATSSFGSPDEAIGRSVSINDLERKVVGVFREPSRLTTYCQALIPYTSSQSVMRSYSNNPAKIQGPMTVTFLVEEGVAGEQLREQLGQEFHRLESSDALDGYEIRNYEVVSVAAARLGMDEFFTVGDVVRKYGLLLLMLLFVPALNLSGLISGRMEARLPEMGVRKSFGATRGSLLRAVLAENLGMTCVGGVLGLALAVSAVWSWRGWFFGISQNVFYESASDVLVTAEMLFAPLVFISAFLACVVLNVLSAMVPAWWSLRHPIVNSLSQQK